jgi:hypothetical protein
VPLEAEDVPPGSVIRSIGVTLTWWEMVVAVNRDCLKTVNNDGDVEHYTYTQLRNDCEILRPGGQWEKCEKAV